MKKLTAILALILSFCLVLGLTACAGGDTSTTTTAAATTEGTLDTTAGTETNLYGGDDAYDPGMDGYFDYGMEDYPDMGSDIEEETYVDEIPYEDIVDDEIVFEEEPQATEEELVDETTAAA